MREKREVVGEEQLLWWYRLLESQEDAGMIDEDDSILHPLHFRVCRETSLALWGNALEHA